MASSGYQMTGALQIDVSGWIAEIGHMGSDVVILLGGHRIVLGAAKREEWQRLFMAAERAAETYDPAHPF